MSKLLYCIRHGLAEHNINYYKYGVSTFYDPEYYDTKLISEGIQQAQELSKTWNELSDIELVIVSPLKRTLQTATEIFKNHPVPMIALENSREYPMGKQTCNKRSSKESLILKYPNINFDDLQTNYDEMWFPHREETLDELNLRIDKMKHFIMSRPETNIALIGHSSFIGQMKDNHIRYLENNEEELKHCYPYLMKL
jgi:broad specificity phosphatase PhoE